MAVAGLTKEDALEHGFSAEVITTLGVMLLPGVGPTTVRQLGDPDNIQALFAEEDVHAFATKLNAAGAKFSPEAASISDWPTLRERVWRAGVPAAAELVSAGIRCITPSSSLYPVRLHDLRGRKPKWLFLKGDVRLLGGPCIAVVGTREPTAVGDYLTKTAVSACREFGASVVSGLARGVDTIAHEWALQLGLPTVSVLGTGLLVAYPARNAGLADAIVACGGLLISEYMPRQGATAEGFVWRNRLQACLSDCVIAPEWRRSSGTAHTIRFSAELKRPSVSLELGGVPASEDAGLAERHFVLPSEYDELLSHMAECMSSNSADVLPEASSDKRIEALPIDGGSSNADYQQALF